MARYGSTRRRSALQFSRRAPEIRGAVESEASGIRTALCENSEVGEVALPRLGLLTRGDDRARGRGRPSRAGRSAIRRARPAAGSRARRAAIAWVSLTVTDGGRYDPLAL